MLCPYPAHIGVDLSHSTFCAVKTNFVSCQNKFRVLQIISSKLLFPSVDGRKLLIAWHSQEAVQRYPKSIEPIPLIAQIPEWGWVV
jgi:hypothetical protein